jgi:Holliday junction resolvasome RuvABC DNA-binding subunit
MADNTGMLGAAPLSTASEETRSFLNAPAPAQSFGYADNPGVHTLSDAGFLSDLREYYKGRDNKSFLSDEEALDYYYNDRNWRNLNTVSMTKDMANSFSDSPRQRELLAKLEKVYQALPSFYEEEGRGMKALGDIAPAVLADPLNLVGFGSAGAATKAAMMAGKGVAGTAVRAAASGALREGAANALVSGVQSGIEQERDIGLGLQGEFSGWQMAIDTLAGGILGGLMGGVFAGGGGIYNFLKERKALASWPDVRAMLIQRLMEDTNLSAAQKKEMVSSIRDMDTMYTAQDMGSEETLKAPGEALAGEINAKAQAKARAADFANGPEEPELDLRGGAGEKPTVDDYQVRIDTSLSFLKKEIDRVLSKTDASGTLSPENQAELVELTQRHATMERLANFDQEMAGLDAAMAEATGPGEEAAKKRTQIMLEQRRLVALRERMLTAAKSGQGDLDAFVGELPLGMPGEAKAEAPQPKASEVTPEPAPKTQEPEAAAPAPEPVAEPAPEAPVVEAAPAEPATPTAALAGHAAGVKALVDMGYDEPAAKKAVRAMRKGKKGAEADQAMNQAISDLGKREAIGDQLDKVLDQLSTHVGEDALLNEDFVIQVLSGLDNGKDMIALYRASRKAAMEAEPQSVDSVIDDFMRRNGIKPLEESREEDTDPILRAIQAAQKKQRAQQRAIQENRFLKGAEAIFAGRRYKAALSPEDYAALVNEGRVAALRFEKQGVAISDKSRLALVEQFMDERLNFYKERAAKRANDTGPLRKGGTEPSRAGQDVPDADDPNALRNPDRLPKSVGRLQNILRKWGPIGGVSQNVSPSEFGNLGQIRAEANLKKLRYGGKPISPMKFVTDKRIETADGKTLSRGATVWYDPQSDKVYANSAAIFGPRAEAARVARNTSAGTTPAATAPSAGTPAATVPPAAQSPKLSAAADALRQLGLSDAQIAAAVKALSAIEPEAAAAPVKEAAAAPVKGTPVPVPEGRRLAIRNKDTGAVRIMSDGQLRSGSGPEAMMGKWPADNVEVGHVAEGLRSDGPASRESFRLIGDEAPAKPAPDTPPRELPSFASIQHEPVVVDGVSMPLMSAIAERFNLLASTPRTVADINKVIDRLRKLDAAIPAFRRPTQEVSAARQQLVDIFMRIDPDEAAAAVDFLRRTGANEAAPIFGTQTNHGSVGSFIVDPNSPAFNQINISQNAYSNKLMPPWSPSVSTLHHEYGHWAFENVLTTEDRIKFLEAIRDNYGRADGSIDLEAMRGNLAKKINDTSMRNASDRYLSPHEFFANQFQQWMVSSKQMPGAETLFEKIAQFLNGLFRRFFDNGLVDKEFDDIFKKLLPEPVADAIDINGGKLPSSAEGKALYQTYSRLDNGRVEFEKTMNLYDPGLLAERGIAFLRDLTAMRRDLGAAFTQEVDQGLARAANVLRQYREGTVNADPRITNARKLLDGMAVTKEHEDMAARLMDDFLSDPDSFVSIGDEVALDGEAVKVTRENLRRVANETDYTVVPAEVQTLLWSQIGGAEFPFNVLRAGQDILAAVNTMKTHLKDGFRLVENANPVNPENPIGMFELPHGTEDKAPYLVRRYSDLNYIMERLDGILENPDVMATHALVELANMMNGISGVVVAGVKKSYIAGGLRQLRKGNFKVVERAAQDVRRVYDLLSDIAPDWKPGDSADGLSAVTTLDALAPEQRAEFDDVVKSLRQSASDLQERIPSVWKQANRLSGSALAKRYAAASVAQKKKAMKTERVHRKAEATVKTPKNEAPPKREGRAPRSTDAAPMQMSDDNLIEELMRVSTKTDRGRQLAFELVRRKNAIPGFDPETAVANVPPEYLMLRGKDLQAKYVEAMNNGDEATLAGLRGEVLRRALKREGVIGLATNTTKRVGDAILRETTENGGVAMFDGIPRKAPAFVREILMNMTHRDPVKMSAFRTIVYRALSLSGIGREQPMTYGMLYKMVGNPLPPQLASGDVAADLSDPAFNALRTHLRKVVSGIDDANSVKMSVSSLAEFMLRTPYFEPREEAAILEGLRAWNEGLGLKTPVDQFHANAWFAEQFGLGFTNPFVAKDTASRGRTMGTWFSPELEAIGRKMTDGIAYMLNGKIGDPAARAQIKHLVDYGDMFAHVAGTARPDVMSPAQVYMDKAVGRGYVNPAREGRIHAFTGGDTTPKYMALMDQKVDPTDVDARLNRSTFGDYGPGVYVSDDLASAIKSHVLPTPEEVNRMIAAAGIEEREADEVRRLMAERNSLRFSKIGLREVDFLDRNAADIRALGVAFSPNVINVYARALNRFDGNSPLAAKDMRLLAGHIAEHYGTDPEEALAIIAKHAAEPGYDAVLKTVEDVRTNMGFTSNPANTTLQTVNTVLRNAGFDAIAVTPESSGAPQLVLIGGPEDAPPQLWGTSQVKHSNAAWFDPDEIGLLAESLERDERPLADIVLGMGDKKRGADAPAVLAQAAEYMGASPEVADLIRLTPKIGERAMAQSNTSQVQRALDVAKKFNPANIIRANSERLREYGANWLADKIKPLDGAGMFEKHSEALGGKLIPLVEMLHKLPDATLGLKRWAYSLKPFGKIPQPESHKRIVRSLRGEDVALSEQEQAVASAVRKQLRTELDGLRKAGVSVGDVGQDYLPQIHKAEALQRDRERARRAYADYFKKEAEVFRGERLADDEALFKADEWIDNVLMDDGVMIAPKGTRRGVQTDHIDYQRMMRLHERDPQTGKLVFAKELEALDDFLEDNLEAILAKYFDGSTRRMEFEGKFGAGNHAYYDYTHVAQFGFDGAVDLLSTDRLLRTRYNRLIEDGNVETVGKQLTKMKSLNYDQAREAMSKAYSLLGQDDIEGARKVLMDAAPPQPNGDMRTWAKRVDAILGALKDFPEAGERGGLNASQIEFADGTFRAVQRKPIGTGAFYENARKVSRWLRNFNSVTLLSFTALTSFTDVALPLIWSGDFKAFAKGIGAWARNERFADGTSYREALRSTGIAMENFVFDRMHMLYGGEGSRATQAFFNATMLTPWTNLMRELSGSVAIQAFRAEQARALASGKNSKAYRQARKRLAHYGLEHFIDDPNAKRIDDPALLDPKMGDYQLRQAVIKFANETIFTPNSDDVPLWAQTPLGQVAFQLKSYPMMMHRMVWGENGILPRFKHGVMDGNMRDVMPLILMLTIGTGWAMSVNAAKDIVQARGGDDEQSHAVRDRKISKIAEQFGFNPTIHGDVDNFLGWYAEGFMLMGGLGVLADILYQSAQQVDNGAWGFQRTMSTIFGPSVGIASGAFNVVGGAAHAAISDDGTNFRERTAAREVAQRIPVLGAIRSPREKAVDLVAGEQASKKSGGSGGFGGGFGSGFGGGFGKGM